MTINLADNTPRVSYAVAAGVTQTSFTVSFEFFDDADLNVYVDGTLKTLTTDYTVTGGDGSTGSVTISVTGASGGSTVVITRDIDLKRSTDFPASGAFQVGSLNTELDKLVAIAADLDDKASRSLQLTDFDTAVSLVLPDVDTRKGKTLAFNASTGAVESGPSISDVQTVSAAAADIATLADIEDGTDATDAIQTVAGISANVTTVAGVSSNVTTVAGQTTNMQNITDNLSAIQNAATNATTATTKASEAATSATAAASSATAAASSATSASTAQTAAETAKTAAETAETNAETAETNAETAETNAAASATAAAASATTATTQATTATTQATTSTTKAGEAATSATNAATSATNAATSATNAASSATAAAASQTAAATSAASAASAFDNFDDTYLGSKTSNPTVDNDGDALVAGALYFNSTANEMRVYDGANWIAATSAGNVSLILYEYTATSGQTTFSGSDDNSATLSYTVDNLQVVMNGVILDPSDFTATNGTSVVLASGAATNDLVNIYAFKSFTTADMVSKTNGGTFAGAVTVPQLNADNLRLDGNTISSTDTNGNIIIDPDGTGHLLVNNTSFGSNGTLVVQQSADSKGIAIVDSAAANTFFLENDGTINRIRNNASVPLTLETSGSERVRVDASGRVMIGTTTEGDASADDLTVAGSANTGITIRAGTSNSSSIYMSDATSGAGEYAGYIAYGHNSNSMSFGTSSASRMTVDSYGRVLINATTANTSSKFIVAGGDARTSSGSLTDEGMVLMPSANLSTGQYTPWLAFTPQTSTPSRARAGIGAVSTNGTGALDMVFATRSAADGSEATGADEKMRLDSSGNFLVGDSSVADGNNSTCTIASGGTIHTSRAATNAQSHHIFYNPNGSVGQIYTSGSSTIYAVSSDHRLKEAVVDMTGAITRVKQLAPKRFNFIADDSVTVDGFLAHEAQAVVPEAVTGTHNEVDDDGNAVMQGIDQSKLVPLLTAALQEAIAKIETLEAKVTALENA